MALSDATLLSLTRTGGGFSLSEFAARGIKMTMAPIDGSADIRRDVNRNLVNLSAGFSFAKKHKFQISCDDYESPGFAAESTGEAGLSPGDEVTIVCIPDLGASEAQTFTAMVMDPGWQVSRDEPGAVTSWSLDLESV